MKKIATPVVNTIQDFLDYCDVIRGLSLRTIVNYKQFLNKFKTWLYDNKLQKIKPHELSKKNIYEYRLYLSRNANVKDKKNLKKTTINYYLIALRTLLIYYAKNNIHCLPADAIELSKDKGVKKIKTLEIKQLEKILLSPSINSITGLRDKAILEVLFSTGMRVGELVSLNKEQIDINYISKNKVEELELPITGKGGYTRTIYFSNRALDWLIKYLNARNDINKALFVNLSNNNKSSRLTTRSVERIVKKHVKSSGITLNATPHTIRHTYATDLLEQGVDIRTIQEFLGHRNITTTQIYTHIKNKHLRDIHKKFHSGERLKDKL